MRKKKYISICLMLITIIMCSCGKADSEVNETMNQNDEIIEASSDENSLEDDLVDSDNETLESESVSEEYEEIKFNRGTLVDYTYTNEVLGLRCQLDDSWYIANEEELKSISGITAELMNNDYVNAMLEEGSTYIDFYAQNEDGTTLNWSVVKPETLVYITYALMSEEDYFDKIYVNNEDAYREIIQESFSSVGLEISAMEKTSVNCIGKEMPCYLIKSVLDVNGEDIPMYMLQVYYRCNGYVTTVTVSGFDEEACFNYMNTVQDATKPMDGE